MTLPLVLLFAYHYPPEPTIGAARPFRFHKYLARMGYDVRVISAWPDAARHPGVIVVPDTFNTRENRGLEWQTERVIRKFFLPGKEAILSWSRAASRAAETILKREKPSRAVIVSTYPPLGVHLAARRLAKSTGLPWIADYRDPLGTLFPDGTRIWQRAASRWVEQTVIENADIIIANTDASQADMQKRYPGHASKVQVIWNGYDPEARLSPQPIPSRPYRVISYAGSLYSDRTVGPVMASFDRLMEKGVLSPQTLRLKMIGDIETPNLGSPEIVERGQQRGWFELSTKTVPVDQAHGLMQTSDYLFLALPLSVMQVPGKLYDYLQIGRPILAYIGKNTPAERILAKSGIPYRCIYPDDTPERMDAVLTEFFQLPNQAVSASAWFEDQFNGEKQTRALAALIDSAVGK